MRTWFFLTVLVLALVALALGGWAVAGARAVSRPLGRVSQLRKETA